ncbi:MAG TPA: tetratricopeptide repeat protein, partial [Polyangiaceae bacterium]|nr:tetratricopeptide repeat protein [Polyangiaceae bacterium]
MSQLLRMTAPLQEWIQDARRAFARRDYHQALMLLNRAAAVVIEEELGEEYLVPILRAVGDARCGLGDWQGAQDHYREALERMEPLGLAESADAAGLLCNLGYCLDQQQRFEDSEPLYVRALKLYVRNFGNDHPILVSVLTNMAFRLTMLDDLAGARGLFERALDIMLRYVDAHHLALVEPLNNLGEVVRRQGDAELAAELLLRAVGILEQKVPDDGHEDLDVLLRNAARALGDAGRQEEAMALLQRNIRCAGAGCSVVMERLPDACLQDE